MATFLAILASVTAIAIAVTKIAEAWLAVHKLRQEKKAVQSSPAASTKGGATSRMMWWADLVMNVTSLSAFFTLAYWSLRPPAGSDMFAVQCGIAQLVIVAVGLRRWRS